MKFVGKLVRLSEETSRIGETTSADGSVVKRLKRMRIKKTLNNFIFRAMNEKLIDYCAWSIENMVPFIIYI